MEALAVSVPMVADMPLVLAVAAVVAITTQTKTALKQIILDNLGLAVEHLNGATVSQARMVIQLRLDSMLFTLVRAVKVIIIKEALAV